MWIKEQKSKKNDLGHGRRKRISYRRTDMYGYHICLCNRRCADKEQAAAMLLDENYFLIRDVYFDKETDTDVAALSSAIDKAASECGAVYVVASRPGTARFSTDGIIFGCKLHDRLKNVKLYDYLCTEGFRYFSVFSKFR